ncbi:MAG: hypothetical protein R6X14_01255 [bacterium]
MRIAVLLVTAGLLLGGTAGANLLRNGDFSEWTGIYPVGWLVEDTTKARVERSTDPVRSAPAAVRITRLVEGTGNNAGVKQLVPITGGQEYTLTAYALDNDANASAGIGISWRAADTSYIIHSGTVYGDSAIRTWQRLFKTATAPANAAYADCLLRIYGFTGSQSGGVIYFDDASLVQGAGAVEEPGLLPGLTRVSVRPNPARGPARVSFTLARGGPVTVAAYDRTGSRVAVLASGELAAGDHEFVLDRQLPAGSYFVRLSGAAGGLAKFVVR